MTSAPTPAGASPDAAEANATAAATAGPRARLIALDGRVGTSAILCVFGPVGECEAVSPAPGASDVLIEGETGRVVAGALTLTWSAASPATQELAMGAMMMRGGEACPGLSLAIAKGPSPLTLEIPAAERALCADEVLHVWVSGALYGEQDAAYYQVDVDQAFRLDGWVELEG